jgi:hypothetical protein
MKILLIALAIIVIVAVIGAVIYFVMAKNGGSAAVSNEASTTAESNSPNITASQFYPNAPTGQYFSIGTPHGVVQVNNFYASNPEVINGGDLLIKQTADYWFTYSPSDGSFWIAVSSTPFDAVRQTAEADFLATLGVNEADACKLDVSVGVPYDPSNSLSGESLPLSFCSGQTP